MRVAFFISWPLFSCFYMGQGVHWCQKDCHVLLEADSVNATIQSKLKSASKSLTLCIGFGAR